MGQHEILISSRHLDFQIELLMHPGLHQAEAGGSILLPMIEP